MKATIEADGTLVVEAETELECYALRRWSDENAPTISRLVVLFNNDGVIEGKNNRVPVQQRNCVVCGGDHGGLQCPRLTPRA